MASSIHDMESALALAPQIPDRVRSWRDFPYWLIAIAAVLGWMAYLIATRDRFNAAYHAIIPGLRVTIEVSIIAFLIAMAIGLVAGLGRISPNVVLKNIAQFYIEVIRGVPILVLIFTISYAVLPAISDSLGFETNTIENKWRAIIALALIYGAYLAEVFRAGIESISRGQTEAGRSLGLSRAQTMRRIVLPQALRNMSPAIGNDAIAMLKDSSLVSLLAVRDLSQMARLESGVTFDFRATYFVLTFLYLTMTIALSLVLSWYRRSVGIIDGG